MKRSYRAAQLVGAILVGTVFVGGNRAATSAVLAQTGGDALQRGFETPPDSAKPRVWWHWMNGNISKEGIQADLEWMKRTGIGGFQNFDAGLATPQVVEKRLIYMDPAWKEAFRHAVTLADQLGLEMAIAGSPGWSETGGPWVQPAQAMKKLVWSEVSVEGGRPFTGALPKPPSTSGPFQNIVTGRGLGGGANEPAPPTFYADAAVVALRVPEGDRSLAELRPTVTSSAGTFSLAALTDGDLAESTLLPAAPMNEQAWIQFEFHEPQTVRGLSLVVGGGGRGGGPRGGAESGRALEASDDGKQFRVVVKDIPARGAAQRTLAFPPVTAKYFRVTFRTMPAPTGGGGGFGGPPPQGAPQAPAPPAGTQIAELTLHTGARVNRFEDKAAFVAATDIYSMATPPVSANEAVRKQNVIDLTSKVRSDGSLDWTPPAGRWTILRMGYSLTGTRNRPASPEATGLEVDKLNRGHVKAYIDTYLGQYKDILGPTLMGKRGLQYIIFDSWEAGVANWTEDMMTEFTKRRGYDIKPWLPVLTGRVVESSEASDRFLWDFRRTISDLTTEYHYGQLTASLKERGMGRYTESHESGRAFIGDGMEVKREADVPMSAMWTRPEDQQIGYSNDIRESASVAHIYGQNLVAAESLTAGGNAWSYSPETLKPTADKELAAGLNRFVIHTSVHQPSNEKIPGLSLGPFGQWFTRHETWAEQAKPWTTYLSRSSYMLQQGKFVADVLYFYGEESNVTALFGSQYPPVPDGYNYDFANADVVLNRLSVAGGRVTTATGMSYRVLALDPNSQQMSLPVLRKIRDLVNAGAIVAGAKPIGSPSLTDDLAEFRTIADQVFGSVAGERKVGQGRAFVGQPLTDVLSALSVTPDFSYTKPQADTSLLFVHRKLDDGEVYWVDNRRPRQETFEATFRVAGKAADLWYPETGRVVPASYRISGDRTTVPLRLDPYEAVFVVFRKPATAPSRALAVPTESVAGNIEGAWQVRFQPDRGAPEQLTLNSLASWSDHPDAAVKYFSGTGTYSKTVEAPPGWFQPGTSLWLDLGDVKNLAEVSVNGKSLGVVWRRPFRVDVSGALRPGANTLEVKVINLWVNRIIGDQQPNVAKKYTYTSQPVYQAASPLLPSGLLGPVKVVQLTSR